MPVIWHSDVELEILDKPPELLQRIAVLIQTTLMGKLDVMNPKPYKDSSKPGEFPRKRTGFLQASVEYEPTAKADIKREKRVRIGWQASAFYGPILELHKGRLGLVKVMQILADKIEQLASA